MQTLSELLEEAADWVAADRDEMILSNTVGGDLSTLDDGAREFVEQAEDLIARLSLAAQMAAE